MMQNFTSILGWNYSKDCKIETIENPLNTSDITKYVYNFYLVCMFSTWTFSFGISLFYNVPSLWHSQSIVALP